MIAMLIAYPIAPFGFSDTTEQGTVLDKNGLPKTFERNVSRNPFFGPKQSDLVLMGAKFAPCMRKDARVFDEIINPQNNAEADDGCCTRQNGEFCYTSDSSECTGLQQFITNSTCD